MRSDAQKNYLTLLLLKNPLIPVTVSFFPVTRIFSFFTRIRLYCLRYGAREKATCVSINYVLVKQPENREHQMTWEDKEEFPNFKYIKTCPEHDKRIR